ncbi:MAG: radical SAM protein [Pseudomonadota bacterium]
MSELVGVKKRLTYPIEAFQPAVEASDRSYQIAQKGLWLDTPRFVSIETYAKCNASCDFCPYPELNRIGEKLPDETVYKILDEIATFKPLPRQLVFARVNEPFLDPRLFDFLTYASKKLRPTKLILFSNGQPVIDRTIDRLNEVRNFEKLSISFNEHRKALYEKSMGINYRITRQRLDNLHARAERGELNFQVTLSRVGLSNKGDYAFLDWCKNRYPLFPASSYARFAWTGTESKDVWVPAPDTGCTQWFSLNILADGRDAFCCIDGFGRSRAIADHSLLELYNEPSKRALRAQITSRLEVPGCATCPHGMPSMPPREEQAKGDPALAEASSS